MIRVRGLMLRRGEDSCTGRVHVRDWCVSQYVWCLSYCFICFIDLLSIHLIFISNVLVDWLFFQF